MTTAPLRYRQPFRLSRRVQEWSLVAVLIVVLALVFSHQIRVLQGQAELSAVKTTLGALRTAFVLDHLRKQVVKKTEFVALTPHNPFELLQHGPASYMGEVSLDEAKKAPVGAWVFDPVCVCVGYRPIYAEWFDSPSGDLMAWFRVSGAPEGPLRLTAKENYVWQGVAMN